MLPLINGKSFLSYDSDRVLKQLQIAFLLAIGVKYNKSLKQLIDDVYGNR